jgi:Carbohydrate esterase, sialic acid-specific acetylesterase
MSDRYFRLLARALRGDRLLWSYARQQVAFTMRRPFKRALFRFESGGRDLDVVDPLHLSFRNTAGRRAVSEAQFLQDAGGAVILGLGQSNIANECDPSALYEPKGNVFNFNFFDGKCYVAKDPLLGASIDGSNVLTRLGDLLVERGNYQNVMLVPIAHGGTFVSEWAPGGRMFPRLQWTLDRLREQQIKITHIAWQQGEAEASEPNPNPTEWMRQFNAMAGAIRAAGTDAPIYVAQCTVCCSDPNEQIRTAQRQVVNLAARILSGPDIDLIGRDERYDGCHLSAAGLRHAAELWYQTLCQSN